VLLSPATVDLVEQLLFSGAAGPGPELARPFTPDRFVRGAR